MSTFPPLELVRFRKKSEEIEFLFQFKIFRKIKVNPGVRTITVCSKYVAIGYNCEVLLHDLRGTDLNKKYNCRENVSLVKFRDDKLLGIGMENGEIELIGVSTFNRIKSIKGHKSSVNALLFSSNFKTLYSCSRDFTIKIWNILEGTCELTLNYHIDNVTSIFLYNGKGENESDYLISSSYDGCVYFYDLSSNTNTNKLELGEPIEDLIIFNDKYLVLAVTNIIKLYTLEKLELVKDIRISTKTIFHLNCFREYIVAASFDMCIYIIDPIYKNMKSIKIVSLFHYGTYLKCASIYGDVLCAADSLFWYVQYYTEGQRQIGNNKQKHTTVCEKVLTMETKTSASVALTSRRDFFFFRADSVKEKIYVYSNKTVNNFVKKFKYHDALMEMIRFNKGSILSYLNYISKHKVFVIACRTYSIEDTVEVLKFLKNNFDINILMFEFLFSFFSANTWIQTTNNEDVLLLLQQLQKVYISEYSIVYEAFPKY
ncbi:U3 small nucleolar RNA-associated protein 15, putative (UTP15) [Plasmodium ovale curtisi]|uniref:U3 small nucleolar RNA-associated protein 15, putative (UTP15) n=1 Tax=Plasmodium ovale curtisi TaxID=864141 RepID=A0A1A8W181_PLAOA|nr:U3 small nucleolar RNA-associated protein 15, putative (UTP15) [Plasmodium ovale curtisi]